MPQLLLGSGADALDLLADPYMATVGSSWGDWQAITTTTDSLFLDGSVVSGEQSGNRTIVVQVLVEASVRPAMVRACEDLFAQANKSANTLTLVPDDGQRAVYDVFRAQPERTDDGSQPLFRTYTFTFPALPFARSDTRTSTGALAPSVALASFESATTGVLLSAPNGAEFTMPHDSTIVESSWVQVARPPSLSADANCAVLNGQTTTPRGGSYANAQVTPTGAGYVEFHVTAAAACSAAQVVAGVGLGLYRASGASSYRTFQLGVEWLNSSGATVRVDWGPPQQVFPSSGDGYTAGSSGSLTAWNIAARPSTATQVRTRVKVPSAVAGDVYVVYRNATIPVTPGTIATQSTFVHDGTKAVVTATSIAYLSVSLASPVDISAKPKLQEWVSIGNGTYGYVERPTVTVRLTDSTGRWSRFDVDTTVLPYSGALWWPSTWPLGSPSESSTAGAANLAAIASVDSFVTGQVANNYLDQIAAVDEPSATSSPRGTVFDLSVTGSARSAAQVQLSLAAKLTDLLIATTDRDELPLLPVASNAASCPASAGYDGVYGVLAAVSPATALTSPTCVVTQYIAGVSVATQTLTGLQQTGNRYVDFGSVSLPLVATTDENLSVSYAFALSPSSTSWADVLVVNDAASLAWAANLTTSRTYAWVDEPVLPSQVGRLYVGDASDRSDARALLSAPVMARPFQAMPSSTRLLVYSTNGAPSVSLGYYPRWLVEPDG